MDGYEAMVSIQPKKQTINDPLLLGTIEEFFEKWDWRGHNGWWNNEGGSGTITISIELPSETLPAGSNTRIEWIHHDNVIETITNTYAVTLEED